MGQGDGRDDEPPDEHPEGFDDDPEDEHAGARGPLPDPLDRLWLHPTELSILGGSVEPAGVGARHRTLPWLAPVLAGAAGALLTVAVLAVVGSFDRSSSGADSPSPAENATTTRTPTATDTLARLGPSVVAVLARDAQGTRRGSGVCVRHGGQLLTSARVVGTASTVQVVTADGRQHPARVTGRDLVTDLVLLDLQDEADVPAAQLAERAPSTGSAVWLLGAPAARTTAPWMSAGMASSNDALVVSDLGPATGGLLETYAASTAAVVGGALVDASGSVAGIVLGHVNGSATSYAVPINVAVAVARQLDATGVAQHGTLGVRGADTPLGPMIVQMTDDGPAARAGAHVHDLVESINGRVVESVRDLTALVRGLDPGRAVVMAVHRGKKALEVRVQLGATNG
ncbi:MAG: serine protease DegQ [Actinomycetota bacterium]|jgi:putative serine protease PepD|nr:serine protease DegQ [Actinomycetota bacterium]